MQYDDAAVMMMKNTLGELQAEVKNNHKHNIMQLYIWMYFMGPPIIYLLKIRATLCVYTLYINQKSVPLRSYTC